VQAGDRRVERCLVAGGAGADQGALDRRDDEAGEGGGVLRADAFLAQRGGDRRFPALEGRGRGGGQGRVLRPGEGGGGAGAAEPLGVVLDPAAEHLAEGAEGLGEPELGERAFDRGADLPALELGRLDRELRLAAGEVVVDRAARGLAAGGDVAQLHPGVALLGQQPAGAVQQPVAPVAAGRLERFGVGDSRYAHGHSIVAATMYDRGHRASVLIACTGAFLVFLDTTIVNIAFPDISASFPEASRGLLSWVLDGYFVVIAALLVPAGGLADRFGHKRVFLGGLALFTATSLLCAVAPSLEALIAFRVLQGAGAAAIAPTSLAIVLDSFPAEKRATGVGLWGAAAAAAAATGPTLGAALVELDSWRLVFLVNLPLGAALLVAGRRLLPRQELADSRLPDLPGALMLALGLAAVTLGIVEGNDWGWTGGGTLAAFAAAAMLLGAVVVRSLRHPRPIVEPALFSHRSFTLGNLGTLLFAAAFFSLILGNVLFLTTVWGYSILGAGAAALPGPALTTIVSGPAGRLADRFGHRAVIVPGTIVFAAGAMVLRSAGADPDYLGLWLPGATLTGIGIGLAFPTLGSAAVRDVADDRFATASAVNAAFRQVGAVLGTAILIAIVGEPANLAAALDVSDSAYLFAVIASLVSGAVALGLRRRQVVDDPAKERGGLVGPPLPSD